MKTIKLTKTTGIIFLFLFSSLFVESQDLKSQQSTNASEILFFDDFEETINNDATFEKWTTENIDGWHFWHIIPWGGINGSQCIRFENTDIDQNDWLITKPILYTNSDSVLITFDYNYHASKNKPILLYTNKYNGSASESIWTEIDYNLSDIENEWFSSGDLIIENPGDTIYFAFHYEADANTGTYILLDNFKTQSYVPPPSYELVGSSEHFEFYTNITNNSDFYINIESGLENQFQKLTSLWNRPGINNIFSENEKIKIYFSEKENIKYASNETPEWKDGFHNAEKLEIFLSPLLSTTQQNFYLNLQNLAVNEFSQLAISKKLLRENNNYFPPYFLEGFGLYETGFRPRRDSIIKYLNENPEPDFNFVRDTSGINNTLKMDLIISNIEGQLLTPWSYLGVNSGASSFILGQWPNYLKYFYTEPENLRIKLLESTSHFDFYGAVSDTNHFTEVYSIFENAIDFYIDNYKYLPGHRFNVVICPSEPIGMDLTGYSRFNGGAGCGGDLVMQLSPNYNFNEDAYNTFYAGLSSHEFFHVFYNHFMWEIPGGFWAEGSADFSARHVLGKDIRRERFWMIEWTFNEYAQKYNVDLDLEHISTNPNLELDIYYLGDMFYEYLFINHGGFEKIMEFFNKQMDYSVFSATYDEIDNGYINYLKSFINVNDATEISDKNTISIENESGVLQIRNNSNYNQVGKIQIYNLLGSKLFDDAINIFPQEKLQIDNFKNISGIYIVTFKTEEYSISNKVVFE